MDKTWLYHYDTETKQQSVEWRHSVSPHPKNSKCKNPLEKFSPWFFVIKLASSSLIFFQRAKLSMLSVAHLCWCNWRTFWRKNATKDHQGFLVLARQCHGSQGTCNPEETGLPGLPVSWSPTLFSGSGPVALPTVLWTEIKKQLKIHHFSSDTEVIAAAETWLDGQLSEIFLSDLQLYLNFPKEFYFATKQFLIFCISIAVCLHLVNLF